MANKRIFQQPILIWFRQIKKTKQLINQSDDQYLEWWIHKQGTKRLHAEYKKDRNYTQKNLKFENRLKYHY